MLLCGGIDYDKRNSVEGASPEPQPNSIEWAFLSGAESEIKTIGSIWQEKQSITVLDGIDATEAKLTQSLATSRYAHIATHGFFSAAGETAVFDIDIRDQLLFESAVAAHRRSTSVAARNPLLLSGLAVSGANVPPETDALGLPIGEDGILTAEEIAGLSLQNLELVTLSACETGLGEVAAGEGVFGLQRAFHQAGARSVVASLWKVSDNATRALMIEFYNNLWGKKMSKVEALRQAQITMIERYDIDAGELRGLGKKPVQGGEANEPQRVRDASLPPKLWAAFQLSGDWR